MYRSAMIAASAMVAIAPTVAMADTPRELLTTAAFEAPNKARALALVAQAISASDRILAARPGDHEAALQRAVAIGYRGKLTRSRSDARAALGMFEQLVAKNPRDPEAQMVLAGWHLGAIDELGGFVGRTVLGARAQAGETALTRAVSLGGNRAFYPGLAAMMRIRQDHRDVTQALRWAEAAVRAKAPTPLDTVIQRGAMALLPSLRANDGKSAAALARKLLPFGKLGG